MHLRQQEQRKWADTSSDWGGGQGWEVNRKKKDEYGFGFELVWLLQTPCLKPRQSRKAGKVRGQVRVSNPCVL